MKSAECIAIKIGIESGSDRIHKIINKELDNKIIESKMRMFYGIDMHVTCYFMMEISGKTKNDILKALNFACQIKSDFISISVCETFSWAKQYKLIIEEDTAVEHIK